MRFEEGGRSGKTYERGADGATGPGASMSALCWGFCGLNLSASAPDKPEGIHEPLDLCTHTRALAHRKHGVSDFSLTFSLSPLLLWGRSLAPPRVPWESL